MTAAVILPEPPPLNRHEGEFAPSRMRATKVFFDGYLQDGRALAYEVPVTKPESEVMPIEERPAGYDGSAGPVRTSDTRPPLEGADHLSHLDEIAYHLRSLTWEDMMTFSQATESNPAILHKWAVGHDGK